MKNIKFVTFTNSGIASNRLQKTLEDFQKDFEGYVVVVPGTPDGNTLIPSVTAYDGDTMVQTIFGEDLGRPELVALYEACQRSNGQVA